MSAWDDLPVVGPIGHGAPDWCSVHGDIPGDMSIVAHINATHDMTYEEYRALDQMRADRTGFDSFDDARRFKTGEVAIPAPDERQAGPGARQRFDHDGTWRHHHHDQTGDPVWWENVWEFGGEKREHRHDERQLRAAVQTFLDGWDGPDPSDFDRDLIEPLRVALRKSTHV